MKLDFFVNKRFTENSGKVNVTARLRGTANSKSFKFQDFDKNLDVEANDGLCIEIDGALTETEGYVTPKSYKVIGEVVKGAYKPKGKEVDLNDYLASLAATEPPATKADDEVPFT